MRLSGLYKYTHEGQPSHPGALRADQGHYIIELPYRCLRIINLNNRLFQQLARTQFNNHSGIYLSHHSIHCSWITVSLFSYVNNYLIRVCHRFKNILSREYFPSAIYRGLHLHNKDEHLHFNYLHYSKEELHSLDIDNVDRMKRYCRRRLFRGYYLRYWPYARR